MSMYIVRYYNNEKQIVESPSEVINICEENMDGIEVIEEVQVFDLVADTASGNKKALVMDVDYQHSILCYNEDIELVEYLIKHADMIQELERLT